MAEHIPTPAHLVKIAEAAEALATRLEEVEWLDPSENRGSLPGFHRRYSPVEPNSPQRLLRRLLALLEWKPSKEDLLKALGIRPGAEDQIAVMGWKPPKEFWEPSDEPFFSHYPYPPGQPALVDATEAVFQQARAIGWYLGVETKSYPAWTHEDGRPVLKRLPPKYRPDRNGPLPADYVKGLRESAKILRGLAAGGAGADDSAGTPGGAAEGEDEQAPPSEYRLLVWASASELAKQNALSPKDADALRKRLERWRKSNPHECRETETPGGKPQYLYPLAGIQEVVSEFLKGWGK